MAGEVTIAIEGEEADSALVEFMAIEGIEGRILPAVEEGLTRDFGVLVMVGTIVSITSGSLTIADKILAWRDHLRAQVAAKRLNVVIEDTKGNRISLDNASAAQIAAVLESLG